MPQFFMPGTRGAALIDDIAPLVHEREDVVVIKHHYSAFDATPLLMSLRMKFVTHIYLCGLLSNISIYETAADAVRHGFEVTVMEDCMGYRSEEKHLDAMKKMADFLGVSGVDSEELIMEAGAQAPPDADESMFTGPGLDGIKHLQHLTNLGGGVKRQSSEAFSLSLEQSYQEDATKADQIGAMASKVVERLDLEDHKSSPPAVGDVPGAAAPTPKPKVACGPGDRIGEGDSHITYNALPETLAREAFQKIRDEVEWKTMHHLTGEVPRRVAVQGDILEDSSFPIYRHPADESPPLSTFSDTVLKVRDELQKILKQSFNHVLIQLYRNGVDNISEHSDKVRTFTQ